ncbi:uncharacterized protein LOC132038176 [Lycium ferocissimum]|uniref:uncharacterized protein LOC132038176 n=1 Tax=Lycium ferocissimum TaxID=112874 RepID=UPI0028163504|nr:uncharacterized protein LOC132038176 [Lycium ferocissimum]
MATSSKFNHFRSISLPGRSHPTTQRVEEALNNLKTLKISSESTFETMHDGLLGLEELYKCVNDLLNLPQALLFFSQHQHEKWVKDLLDKSERLLDVCASIRELVLQCEENVRDLQFSLRRNKGDSTTETNIIKFASSGKKIKKEAKKLTLALKKMDQATTEGSISVFLDADRDTVDMIKTLREANTIRLSTFQMFLSLFSDPLLKPKQSKRSLVSRLVNKGRIPCEGEEEKMDFEVRVELFESHLDKFENGLEGLFRCMVRSRSSLLNIFSC